MRPLVLHQRTPEGPVTLNMINMDASMEVAIFNFYTYMYILALHMCKHVHTCEDMWGHPLDAPTPILTHPYTCKS